MFGRDTTRQGDLVSDLYVDPKNCGIHRWVLLTPPTRTERRTGVRRWRCETCRRWTEAPVSRQHELRWKGKPRPGPMPDQITVYDVLGLTSEERGSGDDPVCTELR
jgi:hypothetical protein